MLFALTLWEGSAAGDDRRGGTVHDSAGVNEFNFMLVKNNQDVRKFKSYLWLSRLNILDTFTHKQQFSRLGRKDQMLRKCVDSVCTCKSCVDTSQDLYAWKECSVVCREFHSYCTSIKAFINSRCFTNIYLSVIKMNNYTNLNLSTLRCTEDYSYKYLLSLVALICFACLYSVPITFLIKQ